MGVLATGHLSAAGKLVVDVFGVKLALDSF